MNKPSSLTKLVNDRCKHCKRITGSIESIIYDKGCWHVKCYKIKNKPHAKKI